MFEYADGPQAATTIATVGGWPINLRDLDDAVRKIIESADESESFTVFTLNLDHLVKLRRPGPFHEAYAGAKYITADGAPVALLASWQGSRVERAPGADLIFPLAHAAAERGIPVFLFGTTPEVLAQSITALNERTNFKLIVAGTESPSQDFDPESADAVAALDRIAASGAGLCFVALGAPKQELFAATAVERNISVGFVCIGAGLDFIAGAQSRAPIFMQRHGVEWFWRLVTNPRRLTVRYARCAFVLAELVWLAAFRRRLVNRRS